MGVDHSQLLLVHPLGYTASAASRDIARAANIMPPLGLASMAAWVEKENAGKCSIIDCFARPDSDALITEFIRDNQPALVGFSCTTSSFLDGIRLAMMIKAENSEVKVVFGGAHASALGANLMDSFPEVDYIVQGEGEQPIVGLMNSGGRDLETIDSLIWRAADGQAVDNGRALKGIELDSLPFPAYEKLEGYPGAYTLPIFNYPRQPNGSCISSRGCPYACAYCDRSVFQRSFRYNSAAYLYEHMAYLKDRFGIRHINFYDDQFTFNRKRVEELTELLVDRPLGITFNCAVRAEHVDRDLLSRMKSAGCWMVSLGIETGDDELLSRHRKNPGTEMLAETIRTIKSVGIRTKGLLMLGLPGETESTVQKSRDFVFSLPIDDFNLAKFTPFPGSPLYEQADELGEFDEDWEKMDCMNFVFVTKGMTRERLEELFLDFYKSHFSRPAVLWGYVTMLWKSPHSWYRFLRNLSKFIGFARSDSRMGKKI